MTRSAKIEQYAAYAKAARGETGLTLTKEKLRGKRLEQAERDRAKLLWANHVPEAVFREQADRLLRENPAWILDVLTTAMGAAWAPLFSCPVFRQVGEGVAITESIPTAAFRQVAKKFLEEYADGPLDIGASVLRLAWHELQNARLRHATRTRGQPVKDFDETTVSFTHYVYAMRAEFRDGKFGEKSNGKALLRAAKELGTTKDKVRHAVKRWRSFLVKKAQAYGWNVGTAVFAEAFIIAYTYGRVIAPVRTQAQLGEIAWFDRIALDLIAYGWTSDDALTWQSTHMGVVLGPRSLEESTTELMGRGWSEYEALWYVLRTYDELRLALGVPTEAREISDEKSL